MNIYTFLKRSSKKQYNRPGLLLIIIVVGLVGVPLTVSYYFNHRNATYPTVIQNATVAEVKQAYLDILERPADEEGLNHFLKYPIDVVRAGLMASNERKSLEARHATEAAAKAQSDVIQKATTTGSENQPTPQTTTPTNNTTNQGTQSTGATNSPNTYKPYVASVCTKTVIPYETIYEDASYLYVGNTSVGFPGSDGYIETCTANSNGYKPADFKIEPLSKTVYVGTMPTGPTQAELNAQRQQRIANCIANIQRLSPGSNAYEQCHYIN